MFNKILNVKNSKIAIVLYLIGLSFIFITGTRVIFAYDDKTTHPALTDEIVDFYNLSFPNKQLTSQEKEWIVEGSMLEDTPPRWINHFYDPIYKEGWSGEHAGIYDKETVQWVSKNIIAPYGITPVSSLDWLHNGQLQAQYGFYKGIKTWEQGILEMIKGNEREAYRILGHVLHLIEDASVPDHTRNDTHAHELEGATGDYGSPYEEYLKKYTRETIKKDLNLAVNLKNQNFSPLQKSTIDEYLISLAEYSNKYFFSKDTINDPKYQNPKIVRDDGNFGYGMDENGKEFILIKVNKPWNPNKLKYDIEYYLPINDKDVNKSLILDQYFSRLSRQAILNGAGVIDLFRKEIELKKEYPQHLVVYDPSSFNYFKIPGISFTGELIRIKEATQSFFAQIGSAISGAISFLGNFVSEIFPNNDGFRPVGQIDLRENNSAEPDGAPQNGEGSLGNNSRNAGEKNNQQTNQTAQLTAALKIQSQKTAAITEEPETEEISQPKQQIQKAQPITATTTITTNNSQQTTFKECSFNTSQSPSRQKVLINEVAWMGGSGDFGLTATDEWIELKNISGGEVDLTGWQLIDKAEQIKINLASINGSKIIRPGQFVLLERTDDDSAPNVSANLIYSGTLNNSDEGLRLFDNQCNLIDEALANPNWPAGDNTQKRTMERSPDLSWHTYNGIVQNNIFGTPKKENSAPTVVSYGGGGGGSAAQTTTNNQQQATNNQTKILINEIQLLPTDSRFIELYNPNNSAVDLTNWYIQRKTQTGGSFGSLVSKTYFEGKTINANGYFLISRGYLSGSGIILDNLTLTDGNTIQIKNSDGEVVDKVGWGTATDCEGNCALNPADGQSIQRKFQSDAFIDTDNNAHDFEIQTCPSPKTQSQVCQTSQLNQAPTQLGANHIVIGEIQIAGDKADDEFIEIYNPTDNAVSLTDYSIQYLSGTATSTNKINKKNFSNNGEIAAKSFYLLVNSSATSSLKNKADMTYSAFSLSGNSNGATIFLVSTTIVISGVNDPAIIDGVSYGNPVLNVFATTSTMPAANQSFERKAFSNGACVSAQNDGEFLGNGCDADSGIDFSAEGGPASDWEIRNIPNPQNSSNFPEPRTSPTAPENFAIEYASSSLSLNLTWGSSQDYSGSNSAIIYKITDASASSTFPAIETTSTTVAISLDENNFGKNYLFSIQAFDKGGLSSKSSQKEISIPNSILIIAQQLDKSIFDQGTGNGEFFQKLGNGLTGSPDSVAFHAGLPSTPTHGSAYDIRVEFWESDNDSYDNLKRVSYNHCQPTDGWRPIIDPNCPNLNFEFGVDKDYTIPVREAFVFDPNKYYKIRFVTYQSYAVFYGSGAEDSYVYGEAAKDNGGGAEISSSIKDLYFIIKSRPPIELPVSISLLAPQNFNVDFNPDNSELVFNWDKPRYFNDSGSSTLIYQITDISVPSSTLPMIQAGDYSAASPIEEVGRDYQFSIKAVDENGQNSVSVKKSITLPHLLINPYIIASQINVSSSIEGSYNGEVSQNLGSGLAGKLGAVTFRAKFGRPPLSIRVDMYESDDSGYGNPRKIERATECGVDISSNCFGQKIENGVEKDYTIPATKDYVFDPAKYYKFEIITYQAGDKPLFFGSGGDLYFIITSRTPL